MLLGGLIALALGYATYRAYRFWLHFQTVRSVPGCVTLALQSDAISNLLPEIYPLNMADNPKTAEGAFKDNKRLRSTIIRRTALYGKSTFYIADSQAAQEMFSKPEAFVRPIEQYAILDFFGKSVITTTGADHKRQRRITAPSFSETNISVVWTEAFDTMQDWADNVVPQEKGSVHEDLDVVLSARHWALTILTASLFGIQSSWAEGIDATPPPKHTMPFRSAMRTVLDQLVFRILVPKWAYRLSCWPSSWTKRLSHVDAAFAELEQYFIEFAEEARSTKTKGHTLFDNLMAARDADTGGKSISDRELRGNLFVFFLAGHETSAHNIAFALGLLAVHQDIQDKLYEETSRLWPKEGFPTYDTVSSFVYTQAVVYETLRYYPPVAYIPKRAVGDQVLHRVNLDKPDELIPTIIPDGSELGISSVALHNNPLVWEEPLAFQPERFIETNGKKWPRNAYYPWAAGQHNCIGQRFAQVELIAAVAYISKHFKISLLPDRQRRPGESLIDHQTRALNPTEGVLTLAPDGLQLRFERR